MKFGKFVPVLLCIAVISNAAADGRDGLVHWWKVKDLNGDGLLQAAEVYDVMTLGAESPLVGDRLYQSVDAAAGAKPVEITNDIYMPTMRRNADDGAIRFFNPTNYTDDGVMKINYQSVKLPQCASVGAKEATVFARIKWDGARFKFNGNFNYNLTIYANNFNDYMRAGWRVGLRCFDSGTSGRFHPYFAYGNQEVGFHYTRFSDSNDAKSFVIYKDVWYDVVYSFRTEVSDGVSYVYASVLYRKGELTAVNRHHVFREVPAQKITSTYSQNEESVYSPHIGFHLGMNGAGGSDGFVTAGKDDGFTGAIHEIKVFNRWMSEAEMLQCLGTVDPLCSIGSKNDSADEFSDSQAAEVFEPATMPWVKMRKTLNAQNPRAAIRCEVEENNLDLPRLVEVKFLKDSDFSGDRIRLDMDGTKIGRFNIPKTGIVRFFIPAVRMTKLLKDEITGKYPMTLTFTREGGMRDDIRFDAISIDGSWQLGVADSGNSEFASNDEMYQNYTYHVGQNDLTKLRASVMGVHNTSSYRDLDLYFVIGDYLADKCDYNFTLKTINENSAAIDLFLNGELIGNMAEQTLAKGKTWTLPAGALFGGCNHIRLRNTAEGDTWVSFDYFRLEPVVPEGFRNSDDGCVLFLK